jgi:hypothetical protein
MPKAQKTPSYTRGKYNVTKQSSKVICPICKDEVFSRGLVSHIRLAHPGQHTSTTRHEQDTTIGSIERKRRKKSSDMTIDDLVGIILVMGIGKVLIDKLNQVQQKPTQKTTIIQRNSYL